MADYRLFPNEKEIELEKECELQKNKIRETINDMKRETEETIKKRGKISGKLIIVLWVVVIAIVPIFACVSVCNAMGANRNDFFPAAVAGLFAMVIAVLIIFGISFVLAWFADKAEGKKVSQIKGKLEYDVVGMEKKKSDIDNEYRNKISDYKRDFYAESDKRTIKFAGNPVTDEIIHWMAEVIINDIGAADRGAQASAVHKVLNFSVTEEKVTTAFGNYVFIDHRISNLTDAAETMALAKAVGTGLQTEIMAKYPTDPMGTPARVNAAYTDEEHAALGRVTYHSEKADLV